MIARVQPIAGDDRRLHHHRHEEIEVQVRLGAAKPGWADADDGEGAAVERQRAAEDGRIAGESPLPEVVAEDDDRVRVWRAVFVRQERAAENRVDTERVEEVAADDLAEDAVRVAAGAQVHRRQREGDEVLDARGAALPVVDEVGIGEAQVAARPRRDVQRDQPAAVRHAVHLPLHRALHPAEHRHVGADAEAERQHRHRGECRLADHQPPAVAQVLRDHLESPDVKAQPERVSKGAGDAAEERCAVGDAAVRAREPAPLVDQIGAPLAAPGAAVRCRREPVAGVDDREHQPQQRGRASFGVRPSRFAARTGHDSLGRTRQAVSETGRRFLYRLRASASAAAPSCVRSK